MLHVCQGGVDGGGVGCCGGDCWLARRGEVAFLGAVWCCLDALTWLTRRGGVSGGGARRWHGRGGLQLGAVVNGSPVDMSVSKQK